MTGSRWGRGIRGAVLVGGAAVVLVLAGCSNGGGSGGNPPAAEPGTGAPQAQSGCTTRATDGSAMKQALRNARPGDQVCLDGDMGDTRLEVETSGTAERPITVLGGGRTTVSGITVKADHVVVDGVRAEKPEAPGIMLMGNGITVSNNAVISPRGGDGDGMRFFGNDIKIMNNLVRDTVGQDEKHADGIQTFATGDGYTASQRVTISGNRFEDIDNMCIIGEGPDSEAGDGSGEGDSNTFVVTDNFCDNRAGQAFFFDDIGQVTLTGNEIVGKIDKAFSLQNDSVGAKIGGNKIGPDVGYEVGMDDSSERGYEGPEPGGKP